MMDCEMCGRNLGVEAESRGRLTTDEMGFIQAIVPCSCGAEYWYIFPEAELMLESDGVPPDKLEGPATITVRIANVDSDRTWLENWSPPAGTADLEVYARSVVDSFNKSLRPGERMRRLVEIVEEHDAQV